MCKKGKKKDVDILKNERIDDVYKGLQFKFKYFFSKIKL
jgi:hypothetical protein